MIAELLFLGGGLCLGAGLATLRMLRIADDTYAEGFADGIVDALTHAEAERSDPVCACCQKLAVYESQEGCAVCALCVAVELGEATRVEDTTPNGEVLQ